MGLRFLAFLLLVVSSFLTTAALELSASETVVTGPETALSMKNITVFAKNAASALAKAQAKNPDWTVISVKKVNADPKSMAYRVVLKKKQAGASFCLPRSCVLL